MKTKIVIIAGILMAGILPASAQNAATPSNGSATMSTGDGGFAPLAKGGFSINGSVGYITTGTSTTNNLTALSSSSDSVTVPNSRSSTLTIELNPAYMFADYFQVGLVLDYTSVTTPQNEEEFVNGKNVYYTWNEKVSEGRFGLNATKYLRITNNFYFKCSVSAVYITGTESNSGLFITGGFPTNSAEVLAYPDESLSGFAVNLSPGLEYFPSNHWGINFNLANVLGYASTTVDDANPQMTSAGVVTFSQDITTSRFTIGAGLTPTIGVRYFFGGGAE